MIDAKWFRKFEIYHDYIETTGKLPTQKTVHQEVNIGAWTNNQRQAYKKGELDADKVDKLNEVGFIWDPHDDAWNKNFEVYCDYVETTGKLPTKKTVYQEINIGAWTNNQRQAYKKNLLEDWKIQKLNEAGFIWSVKKKLIFELSTNAVKPLN